MSRSCLERTANHCQPLSATGHKGRPSVAFASPTAKCDVLRLAQYSRARIKGLGGRNETRGRETGTATDVAGRGRAVPGPPATPCPLAVFSRPGPGTQANGPRGSRGGFDDVAVPPGGEERVHNSVRSRRVGRRVVERGRRSREWASCPWWRKVSVAAGAATASRSHSRSLAKASGQGPA